MRKRIGLLALAMLAGAAAAQTPPASPSTERAVVVPAPTIGTPAPKKADPRTAAQIRRDQRAFERCLLNAQSRAAEGTSYNPWATDPVEYCRERTSMRTPSAAPTARR